MIVLEMSQNSRQRRLQTPRSPRTPVVVARGIEAIVRWPRLVFHSWRLCHGRKKLSSIECHTVPVSKYLKVIQPLCSIETILRPSHMQRFNSSLSVPLFALLTTWYCSYVTKCALVSDSISCLFRWSHVFQLFHKLTSLFCFCII